MFHVKHAPRKARRLTTRAVIIIVHVLIALFLIHAAIQHFRLHH